MAKLVDASVLGTDRKSCTSSSLVTRTILFFLMEKSLFVVLSVDFYNKLRLELEFV